MDENTENYPEFTYANLVEQLTGDDAVIAVYNEDFTVFAKITDNKSFIEIACSTKGPAHYDTTIIEGWKFHIPIDHEGDNIERAFNLVKDIAIKNGIGNHKVIRPSMVELLVGPQEGKEITIYTFYDVGKKNKDWVNIMLDISAALKKNNIKFGKLAQSHDYKKEYTFKGNTFFTIRYQNKYEIHKKYDKAREFQDPAIPQEYIQGFTHPKLDQGDELQTEKPAKSDKTSNEEEELNDNNSTKFSK